MKPVVWIALLGLVLGVAALLILPGGEGPWTDVHPLGRVQGWDRDRIAFFQERARVESSSAAATSYELTVIGPCDRILSPRLSLVFTKRGPRLRTELEGPTLTLRPEVRTVWWSRAGEWRTSNEALAGLEGLEGELVGDLDQSLFDHLRRLRAGPPDLIASIERDVVSSEIGESDR